MEKLVVTGQSILLAIAERVKDPFLKYSDIFFTMLSFLMVPLPNSGLTEKKGKRNNVKNKMDRVFMWSQRVVFLHRTVQKEYIAR